MFVHFTIYNTKQNPPKSYRIYSQEQQFSILWHCEVQMKISFKVFWKFGYLALEKFWIVWKYFLKELV